VKIYAYKMGSRSAMALAAALNTKCIKHERSLFRGGPNKTVINWGASQLSEQVARCRIINPVEAVRAAGNKLTTFQKLKAAGVSTPPWSGDREWAIGELEKGLTVVARKVLNGHSGNGIEIMEKGLDFVDAPLYTTYIPKDREYRLHIVRGEVVDVQRKVKDPTRDVKDWKVRSHDNGFIFVRNNDEGRSYKEIVEPAVRDNAIAAVRALGLDFGACDVIYNAKRKQAYVLEVNCAPGLEGETVNTYARALSTL
jgi:glutathione synthase/RimK-type ligase-like ATP-grasp enzyme